MLYKKIDCLKYFTTVEQSNRLKISELKMSSVLQQNYVFSVIQPNNEYSNCLSIALIFKRNGKQFNTLELIESFSCSLLPNMENFVPYTHSICRGFVLELLLMCMIRMFIPIENKTIERIFRFKLAHTNVNYERLKCRIEQQTYRNYTTDMSVCVYMFRWKSNSNWLHRALLARNKLLCYRWTLRSVCSVSLSVFVFGGNCHQ